MATIPAMFESLIRTPLQLMAHARDASSQEEAVYNWSLSVEPPFPPPPSPGCVNAKIPACLKPGTKVCSGCRLVSYCSAECQRIDWKDHKRTCRDELLSPQWKPVWKAEGYRPTFSPDDWASRRRFKLWPSVPPIDVVRLKADEDDMARDLKIIFVDAGDLRNVVKTINSLPEDYTGAVEMIINDPDPLVSTRNLAQLLLLGSHPKDLQAADASTLYWASAYMPYAYLAMHMGVFYPLHNGRQRVSFGDVKSSVGMSLSDDPNYEPEWFKEFERCRRHVTEPGNPAKAFFENLAARKEACKRTPDDQDRLYAQLSPAHRVCYKAFQGMGLLRPYGQANVHSSSANFYLFSPSGTWVPPKTANPLDGWK
ncbi:hypothetical protein NMY22_g19938 [Coprinellus aureogranulatus]|nr:hypothetical protein NMY22_g19938 [Coprinellus aureogranulatus]